MTLARDTYLNKRYRILEILGEGGMGAVYKALDETLGVMVAVKENLFTTEEFSRQFRVEAQILATLRHPNLTRVTDHFFASEIQYIVMDYIDGEDLRDRMERLGILGEEEVIKIGASLCDALGYLHGLNPSVLHRDVKPGNVRIAPDGRVFLVDFGLAKIVQGDQMTVTGARAMTPGYSPPEQYGTARTDIRSDIYSLGATLYSALTAALPEDGLARAMNQTELTPVRQHNPRVPRKLASAVEKSLAVQPDDRFQTTSEFKKALAAARGITRGRLSPEQMVVAPPPEHKSVDRDRATVELQGNGSDAPDGKSPIPVADEERMMSLSFGGQAAGRPPVSSSTRARRLRRRIFWLLALILVAGGVAAVFNPPGAYLRGLALLTPATPTQAGTQPLPPSTTTGAILPPPTSTGTATEPPEPTETPAPPTASPTITRTPLPTRTPTPAPTPLGGSSRIAFASDRSGEPQIWLMDPAGANLVQLTNISGGACQPDWSPEGDRLIFISPCPAEQEEYPGSALFIINIDGSGLTPVIGSRAGDYDPAWSPDGSLIAFTSLRENAPQVYLLSLDDGSVTPLAVQGLWNMQPAWNKDGTLIAFISTQRGPFMVWTMRPDGSEQVSFSRSAELKNSHPSWSADGRFLVFSQRSLPNGTPSVILAPIEDGGFSEIRMTAATTPARHASFSPDGRWLVYEGWPDGENHDIYLLDMSTLVPLPLTEDPAFDFDPAWQPAP